MFGCGEIISMSQYKNVGKRFGRLIITDIFYNKKPYYKYICDCGVIGIKECYNVNSGNTTSCGCFNKERATTKALKHGLRRSNEYNSFNAAHQRCKNQNNKDYKNYGGRGIKFLFKSFDEFYKYIGPKPGKKYQLDRINNDGNYEKGNVRWATPIQNARNKSIVTKTDYLINCLVSNIRKDESLICRISIEKTNELLEEINMLIKNAIKITNYK